MVIRLSKIIFILSLSGFCFLVTLNNVVDYDTNFAFVRHVLSMDTTFSCNALISRAITHYSIWNLVYWVIIASEAATAILLFLGAYCLWRVRRRNAAAFNA